MADFRFFRAMGKEKIPSSILTGWEKGLITKPLNFIHPSRGSSELCAQGKSRSNTSLTPKSKSPSPGPEENDLTPASLPLSGLLSHPGSHQWRGARG